jgi:hypothetical protein
MPLERVVSAQDVGGITMRAPRLVDVDRSKGSSSTSSPAYRSRVTRISERIGSVLARLAELDGVVADGSVVKKGRASTASGAALGLAGHSGDTMAGVAGLGGIAAGSFGVNGQSIAVDPGADSLDAALARVAGSGSQAVARYVPGVDRVVVEATFGGSDLLLDDETSALFTALGIEPGSFTAPPSRSALTDRQVRDVVDAVASLVDDLDWLIDESGREDAPPFLKTLGEKLGKALDGLFGDGDGGDERAAALGISFDPDRAVQVRVENGAAGIRKALAKDPAATLAALFGDEDHPEAGLVGALRPQLNASRSVVGTLLGLEVDELA